MARHCAAILTELHDWWLIQEVQAEGDQDPLRMVARRKTHLQVYLAVSQKYRQVFKDYIDTLVEDDQGAPCAGLQLWHLCELVLMGSELNVEEALQHPEQMRLFVTQVFVQSQ